MAEEEIARYYDESANTEEVFFIGVPLADVSDERWEQLPNWVQQSVDANGSDIYPETDPDAE